MMYDVFSMQVVDAPLVRLSLIFSAQIHLSCSSWLAFAEGYCYNLSKPRKVSGSQKEIKK
jgi:hypothetical protein